MPNEAVRWTGPRSWPGIPVSPRRTMLRKVGRRARLLGLSVRGRWRRSLQLRVATYTTVASAILVVIFGVLVVSRTTSGLVHARVVAAEQQLGNGERYAAPFLNQLQGQDGSQITSTMN